MIYNQICRSINFEPAYIEATEAFYRVQCKHWEEEQRATKYLESCSGSVQNLTDSFVAVLINLCHLVIISYKHHHHLVHGICVTGSRHRLQGHYPGRVSRDDQTE